MFRKCLLVLGVIALFLMSGCQLYEDIYGKSDVSTISLDEIAVEDEDGADNPVEAFETEPEEETEVVEIEEVPEEEEELVEIEEEPSYEQDAIVIIAEETDLVSLEPDANDPDGDPLVYTFTSPLDAAGDWQTTYGDAGEYTVTVTASDGDLSASQDVLVIVNRKEEAPSIDSLSPEDTDLSIKEDNVIDFRVDASDLNSDELYYDWKLDGESVSSEADFLYELDYDSAGSHTVKLSITDGTLETTRIWAISVENVNRAPEMAELENIEVRENEPVIIVLEASDPDEDGLIYSIDNANFEQEGNVFAWETTYDDAGSYDVTLTVSDGDLSISQQITVTVENVNRAPVFLGIEQK